jgi:release factor glutamine methyltransferase
VTLIEAINSAEKKMAAAGVHEARRDAEVLLCRALKKDRAWLLAHIREPLGSAQETAFQQSIEQRARREPLQYITGQQEFWGLEFAVNSDVLIPRPETELIVETVLARTRDRAGRIMLIDLGTGSGCLAVSLAKELPAARVFASDKSPAALITARANAQRHGVSERIRFFEGDLFEPLDELDIAGQTDIIVANPPYIPQADRPSLQPEVRDYEPAMALFAGADGAEVQERILNEAPRFLTTTGMVIMEMGIGQAERLVGLIRSNSRYQSYDVLKDLAGIDRVIVACTSRQSHSRSCSCVEPKL